MKTEQNKNLPDMKKLKEIPKWTKKYAQNRMLTNLIFCLMYIVLFLGISAPPYLYGLLFKNDNVLAKFIFLIPALASLIFLLYISVPKWGGLKLWKWVDQRIYREGNVSISVRELKKTKKKIGSIAGLIFMACLMSTMFICEKYVPIEYMQPISAIYCVPFMVFLYLWQRPKYGPLMLLWPALYAIHAILIVAGVPIVFSKESGLVSLNMYIPSFGYGFLTFIIIYIYSRYALKKLKTAAHLQESNNEQ